MMPPDVESLNLSYDDVLGTYEWREVVDEYNDLVAQVKRLRNELMDMVDDIDNGYVRDVESCADVLRGLIG